MMPRLLVLLILLIACDLTHLWTGRALAHDIPNQRVDRAIQIVVRPERLSVDYEISLSELTLTQDLRNLIGTLPGADRSAWLDEYGKVTGPLNANGLLLSIDSKPVPLVFQSYELSIEEHPRYTFHFEAKIPKQGQLFLNDSNFVASEGTSRLAARAEPGIVLNTDLPADVQKVPIRPIWELTDEEEYRTKHAAFTFRTAGGPSQNVTDKRFETVSATQPINGGIGKDGTTTRPSAPAGAPRLASLLDKVATVPWPVIACVAALLGAVHALAPGHGKTLVSAFALDPGARFYQPALVGLVATLAHASSVLLIALGLWVSGTDRVESIHRGLAQTAGFMIAAIGFWRLGRYLAGFGGHSHQAVPSRPTGGLGLLSLGVAAGIVPCWDAVGLLLLAAAVDQLKAGVELVLFFSAGMALVLGRDRIVRLEDENLGAQQYPVISVAEPARNCRQSSLGDGRAGALLRISGI